MEARSAAGGESLLEVLKQKFEAQEHGHQRAGSSGDPYIPCVEGTQVEKSVTNPRDSLKAIQSNIVGKTAKKFETGASDRNDDVACCDGSTGSENTKAKSVETESSYKDQLSEPKTKGLAVKGNRVPVPEKPKLLSPKPKIDLSAKSPNHVSNKGDAILDSDDNRGIDSTELKKCDTSSVSPTKGGRPAYLGSAKDPKVSAMIADRAKQIQDRTSPIAEGSETCSVTNSKPTVKLKTTEVFERANPTKRTPPPKPLRPGLKKPERLAKPQRAHGAETKCDRSVNDTEPSANSTCRRDSDSIHNGKASLAPQAHHIERDGGYTKVIPKELRKKVLVHQTSESSTKNSYDGVVFLPSGDGADVTDEGNAENKPMPPPKPARTFAHDEYLRVKAEKKAKRSTSPSMRHKKKQFQKAIEAEEGFQGKPEPPAEPKITPVEPLYAEVPDGGYSSVKPAGDGGYSSVKPAGDGLYSLAKPVPEEDSNILENVEFHTGKKSESTSNSNTYEPVEVASSSKDSREEKGKPSRGKGTLSRRPTDKPPAPPRPPQPSVEARLRISSGSDCGEPTSPSPSPGLSRWDDPVVRLSKRTKKLPEDAVLKDRKVSNPSYDRHHDIIVINKTVSNSSNKAKSGLKRCKSDEYIYAEPVEVGGQSVLRNKTPTVHTEPIYQDPLDVIRPQKPRVTAHGIHLDEYGYAVPDVGRHTLGRQNSLPLWKLKQKQGNFSTLAGHEKGFHRVSVSPNLDLPQNLPVHKQKKKVPLPVREKVSKAYAILRRRFTPPDTPNDGPALQPTEDDDGDSQVDMEEHRRRLEYIYRVKEKNYQILQRSNSRQTYPQLFEYSLIVGMTKVEDMNNYKTQILFRFPEKTPEDLGTIAQFCFPDASAWRPVTHYTSETYSFVLTESDGSRKYGYCRRMLPPGTSNRLPEVVCIVSALSAFTFYEELLLFLENLRADSMEHVEMMLKSTYVRPVPNPGREVYFLSPVKERGERLTLRRSEDCRMERVSFKTLMSRLSIDMLLKVFASVLLERRIILTGQHLSTLSSCVHAMVSLLYPFRWQHTYIAVLPECMIDVLGCPTPYIIGLLASHIPRLQELPMEEVLIVDLDNNQLLQSQGDEGNIIPRKLQKALTTALKEDSDSTMSQNVVVSEAFLRLFVEVTSHYTEYVCIQQDGEKVFQKELFCKAVSSKSIRMFLEWFTETQMFEVFITDRMEAPAPLTGIYETRLEEYREEMAEMSHSLKANVKELGRKMINLILESGDKLKKAIKGTTNNVYI